MKTTSISGKLGISLIEILLVIVVIAVLAGLLWPAIARSRERMLAAKCVLNLRQVGAALFAYASDHRSMIPPNIEDNEAGKGIPGTFWHQVLRARGYLLAVADESTSGGRTLAQKGGVHFCPLIPSKGGSEESYGMRRWRTPGGEFDTTQNLSVLENRADFFLLADSYKPATGTQGYFVGPGSTAYRIHFGHAGLANTLMGDGHVAALPRVYFEELPVRQKAYQNSLPFSYWPEESD